MALNATIDWRRMRLAPDRSIWQTLGKLKSSSGRLSTDMVMLMMALNSVNNKFHLLVSNSSHVVSENSQQKCRNTRFFFLDIRQTSQQVNG